MAGGLINPYVGLVVSHVNWISVNHYLCKSVKPNCFGLNEFYCILGYGESLLVFLIPWEIMPNSGVAVLLRDKRVQWPMVGWNVAAT